MDRAATSSRGGDFYTSDPQSTASPDPEARGRKRRRDPLNNSPFSLPRHRPSGESSTLRGRCRHRSASRMHLVVSTISSSSGTTTTNAAAAAANALSPELLSPATENHRRSRSPSRSRSRPGRHQIEAAEMAGQRRRQGRRQQRTQSRGRRHGLTGALTSAAQTGRPNLGFEEWVAEDGEREKD